MSDINQQLNNKVSIPLQLQKPELRFCKVLKKDKKAFEIGWQDTKNYSYDNPELLKWLAQGGNYGVIAGYGSLIIFDCDKQEVADYLLQRLPNTFKVRSGSKKGIHLYYICKDFNENIKFTQWNGKKLNLPDEDIGQIQGCKKYVVGAGCIHPSGNIYEVEN